MKSLPNSFSIAPGSARSRAERSRPQAAFCKRTGCSFPPRLAEWLIWCSQTPAQWQSSGAFNKTPVEKPPAPEQGDARCGSAQPMPPTWSSHTPANASMMMTHAPVNSTNPAVAPMVRSTSSRLIDLRGDPNIDRSGAASGRRDRWSLISGLSHS